MLYREDLDVMQCATPDCDHTAHDDSLFLHSRCHSDAATWVEYKDGEAVVTCAICQRVVASLAVASKNAT